MNILIKHHSQIKTFPRQQAYKLNIDSNRKKDGIKKSQKESQPDNKNILKLDLLKIHDKCNTSLVHEELSHIK